MYADLTPQQTEILLSKLQKLLLDFGVEDYFFLIMLKDGAVTTMEADDEGPAFGIIDSVDKVATQILSILQKQSEEAIARKN